MTSIEFPAKEPAAIVIDGVWKIFGEQPQRALEDVRTNQLGKAEVLAKYNCVVGVADVSFAVCLLYTSPSPRDRTRSRMPSSA